MAKLLYDGKNLTLITKATSEVIGIIDILYVETDRRKVNIVTDKERYSLIIDIGQLRRVLEIKEEFLSCHKNLRNKHQESKENERRRDSFYE